MPPQQGWGDPSRDPYGPGNGPPPPGPYGPPPPGQWGPPPQGAAAVSALHMFCASLFCSFARCPHEASTMPPFCSGMQHEFCYFMTSRATMHVHSLQGSGVHRRLCSRVRTAPRPMPRMGPPLQAPVTSTALLQHRSSSHRHSSSRRLRSSSRGGSARSSAPATMRTPPSCSFLLEDAMCFNRQACVRCSRALCAAQGLRQRAQWLHQ